MNSPLHPKDADVDETARRLSAMVRFEIALGLARKQWHPISGAGSQSEEWDLYRRIERASDSIMRKRETELAEEYEEEEA
jgi:hypothetical protein